MISANKLTVLKLTATYHSVACLTVPVPLKVSSMLEFYDDLTNLENRTESVGPISPAGADSLSGSYGGLNSVVQKLRAA